MINSEGWGRGEGWGEEGSLGAQGFTFLSTYNQVSLMEGRRCRGGRMTRDVARDAEQDFVTGTKVSLLWFWGGECPEVTWRPGGRGQGHWHDTRACFKSHLKSSKWVFGGNDETFLRRFVTSCRKSMATRSQRACHPPWKNWPHGWQEVVRGWAGQT